MRLTIFIAVLAAAVAASVTLVIPRWDEIRAALDENSGNMHTLFADEWAARLEANPLFASGQGEHAYDDRLPDASAAAHAARLTADRAFLARLDAVDRDRLSDEDQLNYDLFRFVLENRITAAGHRGWRIPLLSDSGFHSRVVRMYESMPFQTVADYETYIRRLRAVPKYFDDNIANMRTGMAEGFVMPGAILGKITPSIAAHLVNEADKSAFYAPLRQFPATVPADQRAVLQGAADAAILDAVVPAYDKFLLFMANEYIPAARDTLGANALPDGDDYYADQVKFYTTLDITPEEVHRIGIAEVERIKGEMEAIIASLGYSGTFEQFLEMLRTDPRFYVTEPEQLLKEASWIAKQVDVQLPKLFGKLPRKPYGVRAVPDDIAANYTTGRYWGAPEGGDRGGLYMVNTYALDKRPLYALPSLTLHEAVPGHHLQNALSAELENVPEFRKALYPHAFGEGWGLYSEKLGLEMGLYEDPYANFGRLTYEMWRAGRLVVDTGIHSMGWSRQHAVDLFVQNSALSLHNINTEVDRYISWPGQALAYKMGELTILRLRAKAEEALGDEFDIRSFHDAVLAAGGLPMTILEARIDAWIADQQSLWNVVELVEGE